MNVAIVSESPADEAALRILVEAVLARPVTAIGAPTRRAGGVGGALAIIGPTLRWLHYGRRADALVVVVDANDSPMHSAAPNETCPDAAECRLCRLRREIARAQGGLSPLPERGRIHTAAGLAVPAVEAWYLCGRDPNVSENAWIQGQAASSLPYTRKELKRKVYGTSRPSLAMETERAIAEMTRVASALDMLERKFPVGFGALLADLRRWPKA